MTSYARVATPLGELVVSGVGSAVNGVWFEPHRGMAPVRPGWRRDDDLFVGAAAQLLEWFAGARRVFDLNLSPGGTPFQRRVWDALLRIPYGTTVTYGTLANEVGGSPRSVGAANACNPLSIIVPCHRLVGADGSLTGYGGGIERKQWLLEHEASVVAGNVGDLSLQP